MSRRTISSNDNVEDICKDCVHIAKPFCGGCGSFPCGQLNQFAYDKEQGNNNGRHIEQCKIWGNR